MLKEAPEAGKKAAVPYMDALNRAVRFIYIFIYYDYNYKSSQSFVIVQEFHQFFFQNFQAAVANEYTKRGDGLIGQSIVLQGEAGESFIWIF